MGPISSSFSPLTNANRLQNNGNSNNIPANNNNVSVRPNEDNVENGDRSQNSVNLEINSNNRSVSVDISREQAVDRLEQNSQRQQAQTFTQATRDENEQNQLNISPRQAAAVVNATDASADEVRSTAVGFAGQQQQAELAENAIEQFNENQQEIQNNTQTSQSTQAEQSTSNSNAVAAPNETFVELSGQASQAQRRNAFISSEFVSQLDNRQGSLFDQTV
ncbi:hypothetical protein [Thalassomonas actiniarum]|uniref:Uncharacterized protein n=1 Tax=Thalassomonas actiniarum TaxID=485447 RepID=A0AAE9YKY5_9GAMM|nr:hypothetical protein [Thalassomonas actiniarum]WDD96688.1 hypothetical protein SG35_015005 [Thalassomonas actiniarum]